MSVPVIGIGNLEHDEQSLAELDAACRDWGFFQITDHGVGRSLIDRDAAMAGWSS